MPAKRQAIPLGVRLWHGPSLLDGRPTVAIITGLFRPSSNRATGPMAQLWILREDVDPVTARRTGDDRSVCGACPLRDGGCYVILHQAPLQVWRAHHAGLYPALDRRHLWLFRSLSLRIGAYGDPAAIPSGVLFGVVKRFAGHTGYTHQWRACDQGLRKFLMASVESEADFHGARAMGWKPFRVRLPGEPLLAGEFLCPKSDEYEAAHGYRLRCLDCMACRGGEWAGEATPAVIAHGSVGQAAAFDRFRRLSLSLISPS
jgi:hypothetical protein